MQNVLTLGRPGPDHTGPYIFILCLMGSGKPLKGFKGLEGLGRFAL